jgi:hypothetical protein
MRGIYEKVFIKNKEIFVKKAWLEQQFLL